MNFFQTHYSLKNIKCNFRKTTQTQLSITHNVTNSKPISFDSFTYKSSNTFCDIHNKYPPNRSNTQRKENLINKFNTIFLLSSKNTKAKVKFIFQQIIEITSLFCVKRGILPVKLHSNPNQSKTESTHEYEGGLKHH